MRVAVYPGTFDPITIGHMDIVKRAAKLFDKVIVLILDHNAKQTLFPLEKRLELAKAVLQDLDNVEVATHDGLTLDYVHQVQGCAIIRGVRQLKDYEYECNQAACNAHIDENIETILLFAKAEYAFISSSAVKDFAYYHQSLTGLVSDVVAKALEDAFH